MAPGNTVCLLKPLKHIDAKSWFRQFDVCAAVSEWNAAKKLLRLPTLLRGQAWAINELLGETNNEQPYATLKAYIKHNI